MGNRITLSEIARLAQVSKATASYVLNGLSQENRISESTAHRVRDIAQKFGYVPNRAAAALKKGKHHLIALMAPHFSDFYAGLLWSVEAEAEKRNYQTLFGSTFDSIEREETYINNLIARRIDGLIILPVDIHQPHLKALTRYHVPTIFFRRRAASKAPQMFMTFNDFEVGYLAADHLIQQGCQRIAYLSAPIYVQREYLKIIHEARVDGCKNAVLHRGWAFSDEQVLFIERRQPSSEQDLVNTIKQNQFDGLVCMSDDVAVHAMNLLDKHGIKTPDHIRIVGCNDTELAHFSRPSLTTIDLPKSTLGADMVRVLFYMIDNEEQEIDERLLKPRLIQRESTHNGQLHYA